MTHDVSLEKVMHLHHINALCPNIKFTLEMEEGGSLPFLDTRITGRKLDITVYHKQMHMDKYLHLRSNNVKRSMHIRSIARQGQNLEEEDDQLMKAFMGNGYPHSFIRSACVARAPRENDGKREEERPPIVHLPYIAGVSERIKRVCKDFNIRTVFKSRATLHSLPPPFGERSERCLRSTMHLRKGVHRQDEALTRNTSEGV